MPVIAGNVGPKDTFDHADGMPTTGQLASYAAITAAPSPIEFSCAGAESLTFGINIKTISGAQTVTVTIKFMLPDGTLSGTILASTALATTGYTRLKITPWIASSANAIAQDLLADAVQVSVALNNGVAVTFDLWATLHP